LKGKKVSDYETQQKRRNTIVGIFVVVGVIALGVMVYKFGELPVFVGKLKSYPVRVQFPTASGVEQNTPVRFCGYPIGRVTSIEPPRVMKDRTTGEFYHQTIVILSIDNDYNDIPNDVEVKLMKRGLGSSYIELKEQAYDVNNPPREFLGKGSLLQGTTGMTSEFFPEESQEKFQELIDGLRSLTKNANDIFGDPRTKQNLSEILSNLTKATQTASTTLENATNAFQKASRTLDEFRGLAAKGKDTLDNTDTNINKLIVSMTKTSEQLSEAISQMRLMLNKVNSGRGTVARLLSDGRFYEKLLDNAEQMESFIDDLKNFVERSGKKGLPIKLK